jgi:hypothetical protein
VPISRLDLVVFRPQIAGRSDEVNVIVGVIILLKLDRRKLKACQ